MQHVAISILALVMGIALSAVGGYFSVIGLATIFSGAFWSVIVMASTLELSKLVAASWIYRCWKIAPVLIRTYMVSAVVVLVMITSMGIFGYLSKAHIDQTLLSGGGNELQIEMLEASIAREQKTISDAENVLSILDGEIKTLQEYDRIRGPDGAIAVRQSQQEERNSLNEAISSAQIRIAEAQSEMLPVKKEALQLEAEIGPLKYIAEAVYGQENAGLYFDVAVRWIIIILVLVFDPLAIVLILAGNVGLTQKKKVVLMTGEEVMKDIVVDNAQNKSKEGHGLS